MAVAAAWRAEISASAKTGAVSSVGKKPGTIALARTPFADHSRAMARVS